MCLFFFIKKQREKKGRPDTSARAQEDKSPSSISRRAAPLVLWTAVLIVADTHKGGLSANTTLVPQIEFTRRTPRGMTMYGAAYFCWRNIYSSLCGSDGGLAVEETDGGCWLRWHMMMGGGRGGLCRGDELIRAHTVENLWPVARQGLCDQKDQTHVYHECFNQWC